MSGEQLTLSEKLRRGLITKEEFINQLKIKNKEMRNQMQKSKFKTDVIGK